MPPLPTIPLVNGPFNGERRPIIDGHVPELVERLHYGAIEVYVLTHGSNGSDFYKYKGPRPITVNGTVNV